MPKRIAPLSDVMVNKAKPQAKDVKHFDGGGLFLLVTPSGGKLWRLKYRFAGKEKLIALGIYPEISLADARQRRTMPASSLKLGLTRQQQGRSRRRNVPRRKRLLKRLRVNGTASRNPDGRKVMQTP
jgi:hypothetical protein